MAESFKVLSLLWRRPPLTLEAFSRHWSTVHRDHALVLVREGFLLGYVQNHVVGALPGMVPMADGLPEIWIRSPEVLEALLASEAYRQGAAADEPRFALLPIRSCVAREQLLQPGRIPEGAVKLMLRHGPAAGESHAAFRARWRAQQDLDGPPGPALRRTRQVAWGAEGDLDGLSCSWWPDLPTLHQAWCDWSVAERRGWQGAVVEERIMAPPPDRH